ncbi:hypothetical protein J2W35_004178 [Variovorax boronicumulans]|uniref:hypothetical protein n=1 Tax=Variovorax boronicumulans TaxID=436515 RepID=UPI002789FFA5|nr:hypothetical protein [Variovorax boronicumulans]MDQ0083812.1 hypothetical protein [Variovorax boronicumulans]
MGSPITSPTSTYSPTTNSAKTDSHDSYDSHNDSHDEARVDSHDVSTSNTYNIQKGLGDRQVEALTGLIGRQSGTIGGFGAAAMRSASDMGGNMTQMLGSMGASLFGSMGARTSHLFG